MSSYVELHDAVLAVAGIAAAEVEERTGRGPSVRVWLDGSRPAERVSADLENVFAAAGLRSPHVDGDPEPGADPGVVATPVRPKNGNGPGRRAGLGRGLEALIPVPDDDHDDTPRRLEMIAIEESSAGTVVRAVAASGRSATAPVAGERALNGAVATAVAGLLGHPVPQLRAVEVRQLAGSSVLVVVIECDGRRASGSAVIESGMPYALGCAIWHALRSLP